MYTDWKLIPDGLTLFVERYWIVPSGVRCSSFDSSHWVVGSSATVAPCAAKPAAVPSRLASWNLQSAVANASALSEFVPWVEGLLRAGHEVHVVYEACGFGFTL